jgi:hypothetical protein
MDLLTADSNLNRLLARPGANSYIVQRVGPTLGANTRMMYNEAFA